MGFMPFTARIEPGRSATTIAVSGELDMATAPILEEQLVRAESDGTTALLIDLRELTFMDSTGLHAFLAARNRAETNGRQLLLIGANPPVRRMFELTGQGFLLDDENVAACCNDERFRASSGFRAERPRVHSETDDAGTTLVPVKGSTDD